MEIALPHTQKKREEILAAGWFFLPPSPPQCWQRGSRPKKKFLPFLFQTEWKSKHRDSQTAGGGGFNHGVKGSIPTFWRRSSLQQMQLRLINLGAIVLDICQTEMAADGAGKSKTCLLGIGGGELLARSRMDFLKTDSAEERGEKYAVHASR